jgi:cytochrome c peroxidase
MAAAFAARTLARGASKAPQYAFRAPLTRTSARAIAPARAIRQQGRRGYASEPSSSSGGSSGLLWILGLAAVGGGGYYAYSSGLLDSVTGTTAKPFTPAYEDYHKVYSAIAHKLVEDNQYDDGSYGPVLLRLAWHASGTYDKETGTGGSNGATMRFAPEGDHGANAGLKAARDFLQPIKGMCSSCKCAFS